ncbi:mannose-1-phosphate guanylyltransferase [Arachidicoccus ginsenosidimutans]|uniref:mannose-1-phosphate guanylyltransferase n=1 Tax=Arachidicoccus sp. BS20 TaxID=1850526 RepID=UPI0007F05413|nr:sugar phosphate nucleotidyltransferase [Arachidicoccus sp. BS20]ANI89064.1 mannose-1-phosphate guanylyltransferase [Arachidicoccus sp. BS20]
MEQYEHQYVVILAGGIGSRLWPKSLTAKPKQFLDILGTGKTLIQQTFDRFVSFIKKENIFVITHRDYYLLVHAQLPGLPVENIILEPSRKSTAPSVAYISMKLMALDPNANLIVAPSDHIIIDKENFATVIQTALDFSSHLKALVTLGIKPLYPNTGYGYIQYETREVASNIYKVKTFTEKPNLDLAKVFLESGEFLWNSGIFVWRVKSVLAAIEKYQPELFEVFEAEKEFFNTEKEAEAIERIYPLCTNVSIDFAIMEKSQNVYVIPASFGWNDLGNWSSAYENLEKDYLGNAVAGKHILVIDATKCMVSAPDKKLVVLQGLDDFIVVDTKDTLLICKKEKESEIKDYVAEVKRNFDEDYL